MPCSGKVAKHNIQENSEEKENLEKCKSECVLLSPTLVLFELREDYLCDQHHNNQHHQCCYHHHHLDLIFELVEEWNVVVGGDLLALPV